MNFFENAAWVPLIMAGLSVAQGRTTNACSLVNLLPTMVEIGGGSPEMFGTPFDG